MPLDVPMAIVPEAWVIGQAFWLPPVSSLPESLLLLRSLRLVQSPPEGHLLLLELHTHSCGKVQLQILFILVIAWPAGQLLIIGVPISEEKGERILLPPLCLTSSYPSLIYLPLGHWRLGGLYGDDV